MLLMCDNALLMLHAPSLSLATQVSNEKTCFALKKKQKKNTQLSKGWIETHFVWLSCPGPKWVSHSNGPLHRLSSGNLEH